MRKYVWLAAVGLGLLLLGVLTPLATSQAAVQYARTFAYGGHARQSLDAYWNVPDGGAAQPGLVIVHGGYWFSGSRTDWKPTAEWYAGKGFAVFAVDHRYNTDAPWPAQRDDALAAVDWIKQHAATFRLDPDRIAVLGSQAGGHLAAHLGTHGAGGARVRGVVALSPIASPQMAYDAAQTTSATAPRRKIRDQTVILANCTPTYDDATCEARYRDANPAGQASGDDTPMQLIHSSGDVIPAGHSTQLRDKLVAAGQTDVTVRTLAGSASGGPLLTESVRAETLTWLRARTAPRASAPPAVAAKEDPLVRAERKPSVRTLDDGTPSTPPVPEGKVSIQATRTETLNVAYGTHSRHRLDAFYYKRTTRQPAIVMVHGGWWYEGSKASWTNQARWFADRGYAVFAINYRLNTQAAWPAQRTDIIAAVNWIKARAAAYTLDPKRVVLLGSSSGAHLVTNVGVHGTGRNTVKAVAALSPVANPYQAYIDGDATYPTDSRRKLRDSAVLLTRCTPEKSNTACWKRWVDILSANLASAGDAPAFLVHSEEAFVPKGHSTRYCSALQAKGVRCTLRLLSGGSHGMGVLNTSGTQAALLKWIQDND